MSGLVLRVMGSDSSTPNNIAALPKFPASRTDKRFNGCKPRSLFAMYDCKSMQGDEASAHAFDGMHQVQAGTSIWLQRRNVALKLHELYTKLFFHSISLHQ